MDEHSIQLRKGETAIAAADAVQKGRTADRSLGKGAIIRRGPCEGVAPGKTQASKRAWGNATRPASPFPLTAMPSSQAGGSSDSASSRGLWRRVSFSMVFRFYRYEYVKDFYILKYLGKQVWKRPFSGLLDKGRSIGIRKKKDSGENCMRKPRGLFDVP